MNRISFAPFRDSCNILRRAYKKSYEQSRRKNYDVEVLIKKRMWPEGGIRELRSAVEYGARVVLEWVFTDCDDSLCLCIILHFLMSRQRQSAKMPIILARVCFISLYAV